MKTNAKSIQAAPAKQVAKAKTDKQPAKAVKPITANEPVAMLNKENIQQSGMAQMKLADVVQKIREEHSGDFQGVGNEQLEGFLRQALKMISAMLDKGAGVWTVRHFGVFNTAEGASDGRVIFRPDFKKNGSKELADGAKKPRGRSQKRHGGAEKPRDEAKKARRAAKTPRGEAGKRGDGQKGRRAKKAGAVSE